MTRQNIGIMVNMQSQCPDCAGNGFRVPPGCKCSICSGAGKLTEKETFEVKIPKGCDTGRRFVYPGKADELPGHVAGDVIIEVWERPHAKFTRIGADLYITQKVKLAEALTGVKFIHTHLDGKVVDIASGLSDEVVKPGAVWKVPGLGMGGSGSLFVRFEVDFPDTLRGNEALAKLADELRVETKGSGVHVERTVMAGKRLSDADCRDIVKKLESRMNSKKQQARTSNDADPSSQCQQQ
jgi:DnaJ homolog subfamily A member 2